MLKRNSLIVFMVFVLSMPCLTAQNTGYMGKKVIVNMGTEFSPAWARPNFSDNSKFQKRWFSFNYILSPGIEIIVSKGGTAGIVYHFLHTKYNTPFKKDFDDIIWIDSNYEKKPPVVENLSAHGFGIFYKQYIHGRAPLDTYFRFQFDGFFYKVPSSYEDRNSTITDQLFALKIEFGNDFLLFDRLRLSTGFSFGLPLGGFKGLGYDNEWGDIFNLRATSHEDIREYARSRIFGAYWLGFTVSIGFLAF